MLPIFALALPTLLEAAATAAVTTLAVKVTSDLYDSAKRSDDEKKESDWSTS